LKSNQKITLVLFSVFVVVFSSFFLFYFFNPFDYNDNHEFYSREFPSENKKIIILGSSYLGQLNTTMINETVPENYSVYNLAIAGDWPSKRLKVLEPTISLEPDIVLIGIVNYYFVKPLDIEKPLPAPSYYFKKFIEFLNVDRINPKEITIVVLKNILGSFSDLTESKKYTLKEFQIKQETPFYTINTREIKNFTSNEKTYDKQLILHEREIESLKEIIIKLKENDIKVVLIKVPYSRVALDQIPENFKEAYDKLSSQMSEEFNVPIYDLTYKYADLPIWFQDGHVAYKKDAIIFSQDVAEIILGEIEG